MTRETLGIAGMLCGSPDLEGADKLVKRAWPEWSGLREGSAGHWTYHTGDPLNSDCWIAEAWITHSGWKIRIKDRTADAIALAQEVQKLCNYIDRHTSRNIAVGEALGKPGTRMLERASELAAKILEED